MPWLVRYILYHNRRHLNPLNVPEFEQFLSYLAGYLCISTSTQNIALAAIMEPIVEPPTCYDEQALDAEDHMVSEEEWVVGNDTNREGDELYAASSPGVAPASPLSSS